MPGLSGHSIFTKHTPPRRADPHFVWKGPGIKLGIKVDNHGHRNSTTQFCCVTARIKNLDPFLIYIYREPLFSNAFENNQISAEKPSGFWWFFQRDSAVLWTRFVVSLKYHLGSMVCLIVEIFKYPGAMGVWLWEYSNTRAPAGINVFTVDCITTV